MTPRKTNVRTPGPVLVTGGSGFLGGHVVEMLREAGYSVRALVRAQSRTSLIASPGLAPIEGDLLDSDSLVRACTGCSGVVHCAALVRDWGDREQIHAVNVEGMRHLLEAALQTGVARLVEVSSVGVYGMGHHLGTDETAPRRHSGDPYADSKVRAEELVEEYQRTHGLATVILRPGIIFGPGDQAFLPRLLRHLRDGRFRYVGRGENLQTLVFVDDVARAAVRALERERAVGQIYNLTPVTPLTTRRFVETLAREAGLPCPTLSIHPALAWGFSYVERLLHPWLGQDSSPVAGPTTMRFTALSRHFDTTRAQRDLDYAPSADLAGTLELTLASTLA